MMVGRILPTSRDTPSWFRRMIVTDYYDGPLEGIAECPEGHVALLRCLDWDDLQDVRVYGVVEFVDEDFAEIANLISASESPRWPLFVPRGPLDACAEARVGRILRDSSAPDYVIACANPIGSIMSSVAYQPGAEVEHHDWLRFFGIARRRADIE
jgi:hypothetical protein